MEIITIFLSPFLREQFCVTECMYLTLELVVIPASV